MYTEELFRSDSYLRKCRAKIIEINDRGGIIMDSTVFYPTGGGQPGDSGQLTTENGVVIPIATTVYSEDRSAIAHVPVQNAPSATIGEHVTAEIDWQKRYGHMRVHTALHLLSAILPYPVTGGQIGPEGGRLDFDIAEAGLNKDDITHRINDLITSNHPVTQRWITDKELETRPELVKTMSVQPPKGSGRIRLIEISDCDLQPCGGTHVRETAEIGGIDVTKIEKKGAQNRRVRIALKNPKNT